MTKIGIDNEVIEIKGAEEAALLALKAQDQAFLDEHELSKTAQANAKKDLLVKLGITEDEAKLLLG
jgi:hypothetical protein